MSAKWPRVRLGEVAPIQRRPVEIDPEASYPVVAVRSFGRGTFHKPPMRGDELTWQKLFQVRADDLLISNIKAWEGAAAVALREDDGRYCSHRYLTCVADRSRAVPAFLGLYFKTPAGVRSLSEASPGSADRNRTLGMDGLRAIRVPLPPLAEQQRIVSRIEEMAGKVAEARALREMAEEETTALGAAQLGDFFRTLAAGHQVATLGELSSHVVDGPHKTPAYLPREVGGVPFVTVKNMVNGALSFDDLNYVSAEDHRLFTSRCKAERGDVLYSKDGATRGRPCLVDTDREFSFFVSVALIKPRRDRLDGRFLVHLLNSSWIKDRMKGKSRGDMIPHIVLGEIRTFPVPVPPLPEQRRIVADLDSLQSKLDAVKRLQTESTTEINALMPTVLDRAFKGGL